MTVAEAAALQEGDRVHWDGGLNAVDEPCSGWVFDRNGKYLVIHWDDGQTCVCSDDNAPFFSDVTLVKEVPHDCTS